MPAAMAPGHRPARTADRIPVSADTITAFLMLHISSTMGYIWNPESQRGHHLFELIEFDPPLNIGFLQNAHFRDGSTYLLFPPCRTYMMSSDLYPAYLQNNTNPKWWLDPCLRRNVLHCLGISLCVYYLGCGSLASLKSFDR